MAVTPDVTLSGTLGQIFNTSATVKPDYGQIDIALCGYGPQVPKVGGTAILSYITQSQELNASTGNQFQVHLFSNGLITPSGTYYTITTRNSNGDIVQVEAYMFQPGSWDLSNMLPFDPGQPPPPLPPLIIPQLDVVPWSADPMFDGSEYTAFKITLAGDTEGAQAVNMVPGNLYTFIILQDAVGGHIFWWPGQVDQTFNGTYVSPTPNTYTIQTFVALDNGSLYAIGPGTYYTL